MQHRFIVIWHVYREKELRRTGVLVGIDRGEPPYSFAAAFAVFAYTTASRSFAATRIEQRDREYVRSRGEPLQTRSPRTRYGAR